MNYRRIGTVMAAVLLLFLWSAADASAASCSMGEGGGTCTFICDGISDISAGGTGVNALTALRVFGFTNPIVQGSNAAPGIATYVGSFNRSLISDVMPGENLINSTATCSAGGAIVLEAHCTC
jgi:hypothetical protein